MTRTDLVHFSPLLEQARVVDALRPRQDLLAAHEHVVRVAQLL